MLVWCGRECIVCMCFYKYSVKYMGQGVTAYKQVTLDLCVSLTFFWKPMSAHLPSPGPTMRR